MQSSTPFPSRLSFGNMSVNQSHLMETQSAIDASPVPSDFHHPALISPPMRQQKANSPGVQHNTPDSAQPDPTNMSRMSSDQSLESDSLHPDSISKVTESYQNPTLPVDVNGLRKIVVDSLGKNMLTTAMFFADKLVTLTKGSSLDVYLLAQSYFSSGQYRRAHHCLHSKGKLVSASECRSKDQVMLNLLGAQCLAQSRAWEEALVLIGESEDDAIERTYGGDAVIAGRGFPSLRSMRTSSLPSLGDAASSASIVFKTEELSSTGRVEMSILEHLPFYSGSLALSSTVACLRGKCYDAIESRAKSILWLKQALRYDVACYDALQILLEKQMLTPSEERAFLSELVFPSELEWLKVLYFTQCQTPLLGADMDRVSTSDSNEEEADSSQFTVTKTPSGLVNSQPIPTRLITTPTALNNNIATLSNLEGSRSLAESSSLKLSLARWHFSRDDFKACCSLVKPLLDSDPFAEYLLPYYVSSLVQLNQPQELFRCSQKFVEGNPNGALSWFAVGCYYFLVGKFDAARKFWGKCVGIDPLFAPVWLVWGHSHAAQDQTDQALVCYRAAEKLLPGSVIPVLCIGSEQLRTRADAVAFSSLKRALSLDENEPLVHHELGVAYYRERDYDEACKSFEKTLQLVPHETLALWEPTLFNLGHARRKLGKFDEAVEAYRAALAIRPGSASIHAALAFTLHLQFKLDEAITLYHRALMLEPQDVFVNSMLVRALESSSQVLSLDDLYNLQ